MDFGPCCQGVTPRVLFLLHWPQQPSPASSTLFVWCCLLKAACRGHAPRPHVTVATAPLSPAYSRHAPAAHVELHHAVLSRPLIGGRAHDNVTGREGAGVEGNLEWMKGQKPLL
ncbi:hypothetical protein NDU88_001211 [Pleurodeles waltl]|uniref:Uncharacterized protein n=1 Tax=Pleurodeles waltl TaxID=8319 RepID=A0AAV7U8P3_PLEWA|nr:hypothetical protein NDU88_001211 [Pleurodeles waltl]